MKEKIEKDARGQFARSQAGRTNDGVHGAKPVVVTGSEDATVHRTPPGAAKKQDWDLNFDPAQQKEDADRG